MSILKSLFGPSEAEQAWKHFCRMYGATFVDAAWFSRDDKIQFTSSDTIITMDVLRHDHVVLTRVRAPFVNNLGLQFRVSNISRWTRVLRGIATLGKSLANSTQLFPLNLLPSSIRDFIRGLDAHCEKMDVRLGHQEFDEEFHIFGTDPDRIRGLFSDPEITSLIRAQTEFFLEAGRIPPQPHLPQQMAHLHSQQRGIIKNDQQLRRLFELFSKLANRIDQMERSESDSAERIIRDLSRPAQQYREDNVILWDSNMLRWRAADGAGQLCCRDALPFLKQTIHDDDQQLRCKSIKALGEIGDHESIPDLIPFLGDGSPDDRNSPSGTACEALKQLGASSIVDAFLNSIRRQPGAFSKLNSEQRSQFIDAYTRMLSSGDDHRIADASWSLAQLRAVEALPALRALRLHLILADDHVRNDWREAVEMLEAFASLPRSAQSTSASSDLPRHVEQMAPQTEYLPRAEHS